MPSSPSPTFERTLIAFLADVAIPDRPAAGPGAHQAIDQAVLADPAFAAAIDWLVADVVGELCDDTRTRLIADADARIGEVPASFRLPPELAAHLAHCADCQAFQASLREALIDPRDAIDLGPEFDTQLGKIFRERVAEFAKLNAPSEAVIGREPQAVRSRDAAVSRARRDVVHDPEGMWTLVRYCTPTTGGRYRVEFMLCEYGDQTTKWTETPWTLSARRGGEVLPARQDRRGLWTLERDFTEPELDSITVGVKLDPPPPSDA